MNYKEAWERLRDSLQAGIVAEKLGFIKFREKTAFEAKISILEVMEKYETEIEEEESAEEEA